jgi:2-polyprenyl-3-methyl-5-hydroxy-6-metoxy-1,4-benzoquinol methylase
LARAGRQRADLEPMRYRAAHGLLREHIARYRFAAERARGHVLDAGCGSGYGSLLLAASDQVAEVLGVDRSASAIEHARRYYRASRVRFEKIDLLAGALSSRGPFDTIVCLEVLEHLPEPERLLGALDGRLRPGGRLLLSTPLGKGRGVPSGQPDHYFQLRRDELERMLSVRFRFRLFGQKGESIEAWRRGHRYFLMLAVCRSRTET